MNMEEHFKDLTGISHRLSQELHRSKARLRGLREKRLAELVGETTGFVSLQYDFSPQRFNSGIHLFFDGISIYASGWGIMSSPSIEAIMRSEEPTQREYSNLLRVLMHCVDFPDDSLVVDELMGILPGFYYDAEKREEVLGHMYGEVKELHKKKAA